MIPHRPLSAAAPETTITLTLYPLYIADWIYKTSMNPRGRKQLGHYWGPEGGRTGDSGLVSGPGFHADAADFPPGTRLTVTARLELPCDRCNGTAVDPQDSSPGTLHGHFPEPPALEPCRVCQFGTPLEPGDEWRHGDVVLAADGRIWTRAHPDDQAQGWLWVSGAEVTANHGQSYASEGSCSDDTPAHPPGPQRPEVASVTAPLSPAPSPAAAA
ncbi:hypothetical protein ACIBBE_46580 [Streptomyces sp. NPDC051644]|uniref:hypothetical protein n=1 Tax=Streptomyces sp. NPDC051644 TaxID=3365666 RepID=UPI00378A38D4